MKKVPAGSFICMSCTSKVQEETINQELNVNKNYNVEIEKIKEAGNGIYDDAIITDKNIAIMYSNMILENVLDKDINKYEEVLINYDEEKEIWISTYILKGNVLGGDVNITIDKNTGEVLLIWFGE